LFNSIKANLAKLCNQVEDLEKSYSRICGKSYNFVSIKDDCIYVNDIKIIDKKAKLQFAIFKILINQYADECAPRAQSRLHEAMNVD
jgi:hypothetical protein